jgi:hypothetical protein
MQCQEATAMQISPPFKSYGVRARIAWPSLLVIIAYSVYVYTYCVPILNEATVEYPSTVHTVHSFENWRSNQLVGVRRDHSSTINHQLVSLPLFEQRSTSHCSIQYSTLASLWLRRRLHLVTSPNRTLFGEESMQIPTSGGDVLSQAGCWWESNTCFKIKNQSSACFHQPASVHPQLPSIRLLSLIHLLPSCPVPWCFHVESWWLTVCICQGMSSARIISGYSPHRMLPSCRLFRRSPASGHIPLVPSLAWCLLHFDSLATIHWDHRYVWCFWLCWFQECFIKILWMNLLS